MHTKLEELLKKYNCIHKKEIILKSGNKSNIYYDLKKASGFPEILNFVVKELEIIIPHNSNISCVATGAISYAAALAFITNSNFSYVRTDKKNHGTENLIEGYIDKSKEIYLLEDVCTTGNSIFKAEKTLIEAGFSNIIKICILKRNKDLEIKTI